MTWLYVTEAKQNLRVKYISQNLSPFRQISGYAKSEILLSNVDPIFESRNVETLVVLLRN